MLTDGVLVNRSHATNGMGAAASHMPASSTAIRYEQPPSTVRHALVYDVFQSGVSIGTIALEVSGTVAGANDATHDSKDGALDHVIFNNKFLTVVRIAP